MKVAHMTTTVTIRLPRQERGMGGGGGKAKFYVQKKISFALSIFTPVGLATMLNLQSSLFKEHGPYIKV